LISIVKPTPPQQSKKFPQKSRPFPGKVPVPFPGN